MGRSKKLPEPFSYHHPPPQKKGRPSFVKTVWRVRGRVGPVGPLVGGLGPLSMALG